MSAFTVLNPATGEPVATVGGTSAEEADEAVVRAVAALPAWRAVAPGDRARLLRRFAAAVDAADADLEKAAATAPYGVFDNAGQDCCARSRILVQRSVFDRFMELLEPAVGFKQSGLGRELGPDALDAFTETKNVFIATED